MGLSMEQYRKQVDELGLCLIGQTAELAPSDKKLYALRDVTATVESIPLICGSILAKKLAEGIDVLVLDVKFGRGAFMKEKAKARELAEAMVSVANAMGKPTRALLTAMEQPLGRAVGNALEVIEAIECLRGEGPGDTMEVTYALGEQMLILAKAAKDAKEARRRLEESVRSGAALELFGKMIEAQGGDARVVEEVGRLPRAKISEPFVAVRGGVVAAVDAMGVALAALRLGAGRKRAEDAVDHAVGFSGLVKVGEKVAQGAPLCVVHANDRAALEDAKEMLAKAIRVDDAVREGAAGRLVEEVIG